jgi:hypothetical protein
VAIGQPLPNDTTKHGGRPLAVIDPNGGPMVVPEIELHRTTIKMGRADVVDTPTIPRFRMLR